MKCSGTSRRTAAMLDLQMPSFIRDEEAEEAEELFYLNHQPSIPA
jgi:hypothetical protein